MGDGVWDQESEIPASRLDDEVDRDELRDRDYGLLQELRVVLPGVQVLVAFLLTMPFAQRFVRLDAFGKSMFGVALVCGATTSAMVGLWLIVPLVWRRPDRRD